MRQLVKAGLRGGVGALSCAVGASWIILGLVTASGEDGIGARAAGAGSPALGARLGGMARAWLDWVVHLFSAGLGLGVSGEPIRRSIELAVRSVGLSLVVLVISLALAVGEVAFRRSPGRQRGQGTGGVWFMAPLVLWAALVTACWNVLMVLVAVRWPIDLTYWLFPHAPAPIRWSAAAMVLVLGGGTLGELRSELRIDLERLLASELVLQARANGWGVGGRLARSLAVPVSGRLVGKLPLLLGEVVIVEMVFYLDGVGLELRNLIDARDAPALMAVTVFFVAVTMGLRTGVAVLGTALRATRPVGTEDLPRRRGMEP